MLEASETIGLEATSRTYRRSHTSQTMSQQTLGSAATVAHGQLATFVAPAGASETRTQRRPASRQVNGHGRVSGTHRVTTDTAGVVVPALFPQGWSGVVRRLA